MSSVKHVSKVSLDLTLIEQSLRNVQTAMALSNSDSGPRDALTDQVILNMLDGYRFVNQAVAAREDWLALGQSRAVLTLNDLVLYGANPAADSLCTKRKYANESHFYKNPPGGFGELIEGLAMVMRAKPYSLPAEAFIRMLTSPQLFLEGNHRTGALIMSYLLLWEGFPPFVLTKDNRREFFSLSENIRQHHKKSLPLLLRKHGFRSKLNNFLVNTANPAYVIH